MPLDFYGRGIISLLHSMMVATAVVLWWLHVVRAWFEQSQSGEYDGEFHQYETLGEDPCYEVRRQLQLDICMRFHR